MKKIIAIIRTEKVEETKYALKNLGVTGLTFLHVTGRGSSKSQFLRGKNPSYTVKGILQRRDVVHTLTDLDNRLAENERERGFSPKRMLIIVANDSDVRPIIDTLITTNQTGHHGDGKIFVCPMISAIRVRNGEQGDKALI
ncbi:MAG: P-II family nitrogen regulator [Methanoregula sp.]|uniref:P-II family nitrogen regulator n=1 Tax=Methanoregula sp. TaxID=2052170 RepID=UPI003BB09020